MAIETIATDEAVFNAANELSAAGKKASVRAIYAALGGGGMQTISAALRRWNANRELKTTAPIELAELPDNLLSVMHSATTEIWNAALAETKAEIEQLTLSFNARLLEAHQEREDALQELEEATQELENSKREHQETRKALNSAMQRFTDEIHGLNENVKRLDGLLESETKRADNEKHNAEKENTAKIELLARVEQLSQLLKDEKQAHTELLRQHETETTTLRTTLEKTQQEKAKMEGMLTVYESIGGTLDNPPPATKKPQARKTKAEI